MTKSDLKWILIIFPLLLVIAWLVLDPAEMVVPVKMDNSVHMRMWYA